NVSLISSISSSSSHLNPHSFPTRRSSDLKHLRKCLLSSPTSVHAQSRPKRVTYVCADRDGCATHESPRRSFAVLGSLQGMVLFKIGRAHVELQSRGHLVCRLLLEKKK